MNRQIKFRAWDKTEKKMLNWHEYSDEIKDAIPYDAGDEWTENCEVMQFTGLLDKNGKEIYEGDIVKAENGFEHVKNYYNVEVKFSTYQNGVSECAGTVYLALDREIIGNIFENPELVKTI